jgi:hypothetical protein
MNSNTILSEAEAGRSAALSVIRAAAEVLRPRRRDVKRQAEIAAWRELCRRATVCDRCGIPLHPDCGHELRPPAGDEELASIFNAYFYPERLSRHTGKPRTTRKPKPA